MQEQAVRIVESVIEITQSRDRGLIATSLGRTLFEMLGCREVTIYSLLQRRNPVELALTAHVNSAGEVATPESGVPIHPHLTAEISDGIIDCLNGAAPVEVPSTCGAFTTVAYPLFRGRDTVDGFLVMSREAPVEDETAVVAGLVKIYENFVSLLDESQSDKLTGLLNRHTFEDQIMKILASPFSRPAYIELRPGELPRRQPDETFAYWLAFVDVDHFKRINDVHGHIAGDDVLIRLARVMKSHFRSDDLVFRYGGEEFIVVLRAPERCNIEAALERFRAVVERHDFPVVQRVTVSIGYTQVHRYQAPVAFLEAADRALYHSKRNGRNRVSFYEGLVEGGFIVPPPGHIPKGRPSGAAD